METVEIHEFSTGVSAQTIPNGQWTSRGFAVGEYTNSTMSQIPYVIERAIANKGFEVSKDRNSKEPTFIGRVVSGEGQRDWSVVAVVTPGLDEYGRSNAVYRYFLCEGRDSLWKILDWIDYQKQTGRNPVFNPSEIKILEQPNLHRVATQPKLNLTPQMQDWLNNQSAPIIIPPQQQPYTLQELNAMAEMKAGGQPFSWAYNVEAIDRPELFLIIQTASEPAYQLIMQARSIVNNNTRAIAPAFDEAAIRSAIGGLISGVPTNPAWIQIIVASLQSGVITKEYCQTLFDEMGATAALKQGSFIPNIVRLLTLRAIVIPETLPEYLEWLKIDVKLKKDNPYKKTSLQFQSQLREQFAQLSQLLAKGIYITLDRMLESHKIPVEAVFWLLNEQAGLWALYRPYLIQNVKSDLETISYSFYNFSSSKPDPTSLKCSSDEPIWRYLQKTWQPQLHPSRSYKPFADLFYMLGEYRLSVYFYQVSQGEVPKHIFERALPMARSDEGTIFGLTVKKQITLTEKIITFLKDSGLLLGKVSVKMVPYLFVFGAGLMMGWYTNSPVGEQSSTPPAKKPSPSPKAPEPTLPILPVPSAPPPPPPPETSLPPLSSGIAPNFAATPGTHPSAVLISDEKKNIALANFPITSQMINRIVADLTQSVQTRYVSSLQPVEEPDKVRRQIITKIKKTLVEGTTIKATDLDYASAFEGKYKINPTEVDWAREKWVEAIYLYQEKFLKSGLGYIEPGLQTADLLKCEVADSLGLNLQSGSMDCTSQDPMSVGVSALPHTQTYTPGEQDATRSQ